MSIRGTDNMILTSNGKRGSIFVSDTDTHTSTQMGVDSWTLIHAIENVQFAVLDDNIRSTLSGDITDTGVTIPLGAVVGGDFTKVRLRSGKVIIYV